MKSLKSELLKHGFRPSGREVERKNTKARDKREERLTDEDWAYLMGTNRDTYRRVNGRIKRR